MISCPTYVDPSLAPEGRRCLSFMTLAPRHPAEGAWSDIKWDYLDKGIDMLDAVYLPGVKDQVVFKTVATPENFESRLLIPDGCIYSYSLFHIRSQPGALPSRQPLQVYK
ncbi:MAG: hypothetical protein SWK76_02445 [Actinomycetota bacterium]|nr:hypothetical protein [Actinomycetota bacterium]